MVMWMAAFLSRQEWGQDRPAAVGHGVPVSTALGRGSGDQVRDWLLGWRCVCVHWWAFYKLVWGGHCVSAKLEYARIVRNRSVPIFYLATGRKTVCSNCKSLLLGGVNPFCIVVSVALSMVYCFLIVFCANWLSFFSYIISVVLCMLCNMLHLYRCWCYVLLNFS